MKSGKERKNRTRDGIEIIDLDEPEEKSSQSAGKQRRSKAGKQMKRGVRQTGRRGSFQTDGRNTGKASGKSGRNLEFLIITYLFLALFLGMMAYLVFFSDIPER